MNRPQGLMGQLKRSGWLVGLAVAVVAVFLAPQLLDAFRLGLVAKYLCIAMVAVGIGLAWGQGGMLVLGQGLYFGLGGYMMAMHMKLDDAGPGGVPDFMNLYGNNVVPGWWEPFRSAGFTLVAIVLLPALFAGLLGYAVFTRRVRGAYFAILSQALVAAFATWVESQQKTTGGFNGMTNFKGWFGFALNDPVNKRMLYYIAAFVLIAMVLIVRWLMRSRFGELLLAVRDQENRVRFLGYDPAWSKVIAYVVAAVFAAIGGALFVPIVGMINPKNVGVTPSILFLAGVVLGGRTTLLGPVLGTIAVRWAETGLSEAYPSLWQYFQGALFVLVIAFLAQGAASIGPGAKALWRRLRGSPGAAPPGATPPGGVPKAAETAPAEGAAS